MSHRVRQSFLARGDILCFNSRGLLPRISKENKVYWKTNFHAIPSKHFKKQRQFFFIKMECFFTFLAPRVSFCPEQNPLLIINEVSDAIKGAIFQQNWWDTF